MLKYISNTFESVPSDYAVLKMIQPPESGGDTLFASGYSAYDRLSPCMKKLADGLTATYHTKAYDHFLNEGVPLVTKNRGHPENKGIEFSAIQSVHLPLRVPLPAAHELTYASL